MNRGVEMMLLIKEAGAWRIVAQAWDVASDLKPDSGPSSQPGLNNAVAGRPRLE